MIGHRCSYQPLSQLDTPLSNTAHKSLHLAISHQLFTCCRPTTSDLRALLSLPSPSFLCSYPFLLPPAVMPSPAMEVVLASRPKNEPDSSTFRLQPLASPPTSAAADGVLLQLVVASVDPYIRNIIRFLHVGSSISGYHVALVLESNRPDFHKGDHVIDFLYGIKLQTVQQHGGNGLWRIPPDLSIPLTAWAGVLGMPGRCAYFGLLDHEVGRLKAGDVVLVSGAAGAVGSLAGQLARIKGAKKVIGTAGGPAKCKLVKERYGFDECLDYKQHDTAEKMRDALKQAAPEGIDLYFDNTGGHVTTAACKSLKEFGRVALAGAISSYNKSPEGRPHTQRAVRTHATYAISLLHTISCYRSWVACLTLCDDVTLVCVRVHSGMDAVIGSHRIIAFKQNDYVQRYPEFYDEVPQLMAAGKIVYDETVYKGLDKLPEAFAGLFTGRSTGKTLVLVD